MKPQLTILIPAYNEQDNLLQCVEQISAKIQEVGLSAEFLIVDDGSRDQTGKLAEEIKAKRSDTRVIHHTRNLGVGAAFLTAIEHAHGDWLILIPADLPLDPNELRRYFEAAPEADVIVGLRSDRSDYSLLRRLVSWSNILLIRALFGMHLHQFQYISMYRLEVLKEIKIEYWRSAFFLAEILIKARDQGKRLVEVEIRYAPRLYGRPTGARLKLVTRTVLDIFHYWLRWIAGKTNPRLYIRRHT